MKTYSIATISTNLLLERLIYRFYDRITIIYELEK